MKDRSEGTDGKMARKEDEIREEGGYDEEDKCKQMNRNWRE